MACWQKYQNFIDGFAYFFYTVANRRKGKPSERMGRKAAGLELMFGYGRGVAEGVEFPSFFSVAFPLLSFVVTPFIHLVFVGWFEFFDFCGKPGCV